MRRFLAVFSVCLGLVCPSVSPAQGTGPAPKEKGPAAELSKDPEPKNPLTIESLKLSPDAILVIVEDLKDLVPKMVLIRPEKLRDMEERIRELEKLLKQERRPVSVCKLSGRLEEDLIHLRGEFLFSTEQPRTTVFLGMQGAFLKEEGELDRALTHVEAVEDGYVLKVEKPGNHQLNLNMVVPVGLRRAGLGSSSAERSLDLGLPGATVTTLSLELPTSVKELRWNENQEKRRGPRWELALGKTRALALSWKEPVSMPGTGSFLSVEAQITGQIEEAQIIWDAELQLEDLRGQTKEWRLLLPPGAKADVKTAGGTGYDLKAVAGKPYTHVLELRDAGTERWVVEAQVFQTRPEPGVRLAVGPFQVLGANRQQGTITIQAESDVLRGERLLFHRFGEIHQKDSARAGVLASFQYWSVPPLDKGSKGLGRAPLELEWKQDRGKVETQLEHELILHEGATSTHLELTTRIRFKKRPAALHALDIQLPRAPLAARLGSFHEPALPFPGNLLWLESLTDWGLGAHMRLEEFTVEGEGEAVEWGMPDSSGRVRLRFLRPMEDMPALVMRGRCLLPEGASRVQVELPRPLGVTEGGTKALIRGGEDVELLRGSAGQEKAVADVHQFVRTWEGPPDPLEFAWRPYRAAILASAVADVTLLDRTAQVVMEVRIESMSKKGLDEEDAWEALQRPLLPPGLEMMRPPAKGKRAGEAIYRYDLSLTSQPGLAEEQGRLHVVFPWPAGVTQKEVKVRLWAPAGARVGVSKEAESSKAWKDREAETIKGKGVLPSLVLFCAELEEPELMLALEPSQKALAPLLVDGARIQVRLDEEGNHFYRAFFAVRKIHARRLDVELPLPPAACLEHVLLDGLELPREASAKTWNVVHLKVEPAHYTKAALLEIEYRLPADSQEGRRGWRTTLQPPRLLGEVDVPHVSWQVRAPSAWFALPLGMHGKQEYRWGLLGWLLAPLPVEASTFDSGAPRPDAAAGPRTIALVLGQSAPGAISILHFSRPFWLLLCSSLVLILGLGILLLALSRAALWLLAAAALAGVLAIAWYWPALAPAVLYGSQPGLVVLLLLIVVQWLLNRHYQRQLVFLPGFTRVKMGSSLTRGGGAKREASTVDAPLPSGVKKPSTHSGT